MISDLDKNKSGSIDFEEFLEFKFVECVVDAVLQDVLLHVVDDIFDDVIVTNFIVTSK